MIFPSGDEVGQILAGSAGGKAVIAAPVAFPDLQVEGSCRCVRGPGNGVHGRDVRGAGTAAGVVQNLGGLVTVVCIGNFLEVFLHIRVRHEDAVRVHARLRGDIILNQAGRDGVRQGEGCIVRLDVPIHCAG